jgi:hypothetical protein
LKRCPSSRGDRTGFLNTWKVLENVFLKNPFRRVHEEAIFWKKSTGNRPATIDTTFLSIKERTRFPQLKTEPADPGFVLMNGVEPNFDPSPEKLRCPLT